MTTTEEKEFELLLSEVEYCNREIGNFFELQIKILAFVVSAVGVCLGLLFATGPQGTHHLSPATSARVLVALSGVMTFAVIQGAISYSIALGYMHYKALIVAPRLQKLLTLSESPLAIVKSIVQGPAGPPLLVSSGTATLVIIGADFLSLWYAWVLAAGNPSIHLIVVVAALGGAAGVLCVLLGVRAAWRLRDGVLRGTEHLPKTRRTAKA